MTRVFYDERNNLMEISGHAGAGTKGNDLVCAAATILMRTLQAAVQEEPARFMPNILKRDGYARIACSPKPKWTVRCREIYRTTFTRLPDIMARENPSLLEQIRNWLKDFTEKLRAAFKGVEAKHAEAKAMLNYADELQQLWDNALAEAVRNSESASESESGKEKHSYAGRNARTADTEALARAEEMERNGEDWDTIRKETGWFRGMDNQWRFEINDSNMEFRKEGDARLLAEPDYQQLIKLTDKWAASFDGGEALTTAEENEMSRLEEKYDADIWEDKYMLRDFVKHDELFDAYPRLKGVGLEFDELPDGVKGFYSKRSNTIVLSKSLFGKEPDVVLHEIQHVIQKFEGFTSGTNVEYWNKRMEDDYSKRGSHGFEMMPSELYRNTAGEIEARDTAARRELTQEERKATSPARANEDTVFANDSERSYSIERTKDLTLKEQLKEYYAGKFKSSDSFCFGNTPTRLSAIGISNAPLTMTRKSFKKSTNKKHNIPRRVLKSLSDNLSNPVLAFYDGTTAGILIDDVDADGKPVLVAIDKKANMDRENVNNITSIYGLDNATAWLRNQTQAGKAFYVFDKKRADTFLQTYGYLATVGETNSSNNVIIPQPTTEVKTKNSARDVDLQSKYPQLDLNEDISELDGVPAIELVDGSILPIPDRSGRYPTHVSFIEANRIDVDDLKSGGWIGNGVYDSSFQSDTARYIERESARKRVAELTGKPYSQFEKTRYSMRDVATNGTAQQRRERDKSYADLKRRSAELERQIENLRGQMKRTTQATIRKADTDKLAVRLAKDMGLTDRSVIAEVKKELQELGDFIVQSTGEELGYTDLKEIALDIADHALNNVEIELDNGTRDMYDQLRSYLKGKTLRISPNELADLGKDFRRQNMGTFYVSTKKGTPVDTAYMELSEMFGEGVFPTDVYSQADMLQTISDHLNAWKPRYGNPFEYNMNEVREYYAQEILDAMFGADIRQTAPTSILMSTI